MQQASRDAGETQSLGDDLEAEAEEEEKGSHFATRSGKAALGPDGWGLDPLFWSYLCLLNVHVVRGLVPTGRTWAEVNAERKRLGFNHALPKSLRVVQHAQVIGVLVRKHSNAYLTTYTVDDGTALLDCIVWKDDSLAMDDEYALQLNELVLGVTIRCFGRLEWPPAKMQAPFRASTRRLLLTRPPSVIRSTQEELYHWNRACELWNTVYAEPFTNAASSTKNKRSRATASTTEGNALEDAILQVIRSRRNMPLISSKIEPIVRDRYSAFLPILFERSCLIYEGPVAEVLTLETQGVKEREDALIDASLKSLCYKGYIFVMDSNLALYACLTHEEFLAPALLRILARAKASFISINAIMDFIKGDPRLFKVPKDRILSSLERLSCEGIVFGGNPGEYSLVSSWESTTSTSTSSSSNQG